MPTDFRLLHLPKQKEFFWFGDSLFTRFRLVYPLNSLILTSIKSLKLMPWLLAPTLERSTWDRQFAARELLLTVGLSYDSKSPKKKLNLPLSFSIAIVQQVSLESWLKFGFKPLLNWNNDVWANEMSLETPENLPLLKKWGCKNLKICYDWMRISCFVKSLVSILKLSDATKLDQSYP